MRSSMIQPFRLVHEINGMNLTTITKSMIYRTRMYDQLQASSLNRTLMHSVISRRFIVLAHTSRFHHPRAFLSRISLCDHNSSCELLEQHSLKRIQHDRTILGSRYDLRRCHKIITPDGVIPAKKSIKENWQEFILRDWVILETKKSNFKNRILNIFFQLSLFLMRQMNDFLYIIEFNDIRFFFNF